jgi:hypothetical protein
VCATTQEPYAAYPPPLRRACDIPCRHRHTEDLDLFSCNFMHCGAPKTWYAVSAAQRGKFEREVRVHPPTARPPAPPPR